METSIEEIFPNQSKIENILFLKKSEWDVYYSTQNKWPYLVIQQLGQQTGQTKPGEDFVNRQDRPDPFGPDPNIPPEYSLTLEDYENYKKYGGSPGHNAPAAHHKTTISINNETFLFSNITPQEIVFNAGAWVILENWVKVTARNPQLTATYCITGSIPAKEDSIFDGSRINIPSHMYKIFITRVSPNHTNPNFPNNAHENLYIACFLYPNIPINPIPKNTAVWKYLITLDELTAKANINFMPILMSKTGVKINKDTNAQILHLSRLFPIQFEPNMDLKLQMIKALFYGVIIYSQTLESLDENWAKLVPYTEKFKTLKFHREYYDLAKARILGNQPLFIPHLSYPNLFLIFNNSTATTISSRPNKKTTTKKKKTFGN